VTDLELPCDCGGPSCDPNYKPGHRPALSLPMVPMSAEDVALTEEPQPRRAWVAEQGPEEPDRFVRTR
jgi:hypothetical protein